MLIIGHRGASGYEPENTIRSFKKAIELGVDIIEFDVHLCKSGEIVVIHDEKVNRTTNGHGYIREKTIEELKKLDMGKGEKIPTLGEVLDLVNRRVKINIELKGEKTAKPVYAIIQKYIQKCGWTYDNFLISSFDNSQLKEMRELDSKIKIGIIAQKIRGDLPELAKKLRPYSLNINSKSRFLTKGFVDFWRNQRVKIFVWTVNDKKNIERLKSIGVDGIFSDYPDML